MVSRGEGRKWGRGGGGKGGKDCTCKEHSLLSEACHKEVLYEAKRTCTPNIIMLIAVFKNLDEILCYFLTPVKKIIIFLIVKQCDLNLSTSYCVFFCEFNKIKSFFKGNRCELDITLHIWRGAIEMVTVGKVFWKKFSEIKS